MLHASIKAAAPILALTLLTITAAPLLSTPVDNIVCPSMTDADKENMAVDQYYAGVAHEKGYCGFETDITAALSWYEKAANQNFTLAAYALGEAWFTGTAGKLDYVKAKKWYQQAAQAGHGLSQLRLGFLYAENHFKGLTVDYEEAEKWFHKAASQKAGDAVFRLGNFYNNYKEPRDYKSALKWLTQAAEGGHRIAMFDVARLHQTGQGTPRDPQQAFIWMKKASDADVMQARVALSDMYARGEGTEKNIPAALKLILGIANKPTASVFWLNKAGDIFYEGWESVPVNYPTARKYYERAAQKGDPHALTRLGTMYKDGQGVPANPEKAERYFQQATEKGALEE